MRRACSVLVVAWIFSLVSLGCGGGDSGVRVTGSVTTSTTSPANIVLRFIPQSQNEAENAKSAITDAGGKFETSLVPGKYSVVLTKKVDASGNVPGPDVDVGQLEEGALSEAIPAQYTQYETTPLSVEIPPGGKDLEPFVVEGG